MSFDPEEFGRFVAKSVNNKLDPIIKAVAAMEAAAAKMAEEITGLKAENETLKSSISSFPDAEAVAKRAAEMVPTPQDGKDGKDGKDGADGADGKDGAPGRDGVDGADGKDGTDGKDAAPVSESAIADSVAAAFERRFSDLALSWERQARDEIAKALDRMPVPKDGRDGLPADAISIKSDGERTVTITVGETVEKLYFPSIIYRDVWREGEYQKNDAVTWANSLWIALKDTSEAPGSGKDWRLAVRKGRDGRDLRDSASQHNSDEGVSV